MCTHVPGLGSIARSLSTWPATAADAPGIYRPRHPERTSFYRIFEQHFCEYVGTYEERFEYRSGPLRKIVVPTVEAYLDCGRLVNGFARIRCPQCGSEHLLAFSCKGKLCPSCLGRRTADTAAWLVDRLLPEAPYRQWVLTSIGHNSTAQSGETSRECTPSGHVLALANAHVAQGLRSACLGLCARPSDAPSRVFARGLVSDRG